MSRTLLTELVAAEGRVEELEAEVERLRAETVEHRAYVDTWAAELAAANALLVVVRDDPKQQRGSWWRRIDAHLAGQPATAPAEPEPA